ncbi:hypothetical protein [Actinomyces ruminicola]|uniref:Excreted virulence factor EspC, type VII ESX diderm n=1 Tax=Actinomyces ruminicola TaxID=332524 RepID=A0A1G9V230_9ACTO|nr:hypothetical protein [Actinomyces ruminicola]SDM66056.1 hypothetical protein SAMN04487766_10563 [Actinomyces ruminicola]
MPYSYYDDADYDDGAGSGDAVMVNNPKLEAIQDVKEQATRSRSGLADWTPPPDLTRYPQVTGYLGIPQALGLSEDVWTSPVADDYRTAIDSAHSGAEEAISQIVTDLTDAENAIYDAGQDRVPEDSPLASWPNT